MITLDYLKDTKNWTLLFESVMLNDTCAPASILSYYLDYVVDNGSIFCPLGYELYKVIGHAMREDPEAFDAAVETGLMGSAIRTYVDAALDGWENWDLMKNVVLRLMADPRLSIYISYYNRLYIENLKAIETEDTWCDTYEHLNEIIKQSIPKGY